MPNTDVLAPIQQALYSKLTGDSPLMADISGVYDHVPEGAAFPYIRLGGKTTVPQGAHDRFGRRSTVTLHVWSAYHGFAEAQGIVNHLLRLLDHQALTITDHLFVSMRHQQTVELDDPDPDLRHIAVRFAIETEHPA